MSMDNKFRKDETSREIKEQEVMVRWKNFRVFHNKNGALGRDDEIKSMTLLEFD